MRQVLGSGIPQPRDASGKPSQSHPQFRPHLMQGWAPDFISKLTEDAVAAGLHRRDRAGRRQRCADARSRELAQQEGIFVGTSSGATLAAALDDCAPLDSRHEHRLHAARHRRAVPVDAAVRGHQRGDDGRGARACRARRRRAASMRRRPLLAPAPAAGGAAPTRRCRQRSNSSTDDRATTSPSCCSRSSGASSAGRVRKLFARLGIAYRSVDLDSVAFQADDLGGKIRAVLAARTGAQTMPQVFIGGDARRRRHGRCSTRGAAATARSCSASAACAFDADRRARSRTRAAAEVAAAAQERVSEDTDELHVRRHVPTRHRRRAILHRAVTQRAIDGACREWELLPDRRPRHRRPDARRRSTPADARVLCAADSLEARDRAHGREPVGLLRPRADEAARATGSRSTTSVRPTAARRAANGRASCRGFRFGDRRAFYAECDASRSGSSLAGHRRQSRHAAGRARLVFRPGRTSFLRLELLPAVPAAGAADGRTRDGGRSPRRESSTPMRRALTLLLQDDQPGLEVLHDGGVAPRRAPRRDALVVNIGDIVQVWSNDRYHRRAAPRPRRDGRASASARRSSSTRLHRAWYAPLLSTVDAEHPRGIARFTGANSAHGAPPATTPTTAGIPLDQPILALSEGDHVMAFIDTISASWVTGEAFAMYDRQQKHLRLRARLRERCSRTVPRSCGAGPSCSRRSSARWTSGGSSSRRSRQP